MEFSTYRQTSGPEDYTYKVVELPEELVEYTKQQKGKLELKAPVSVKNHLVLCTEEKTYTMRQLNHSNAVLLTADMGLNTMGKQLLNESPQNLLSFAQCSYQYELTPTSGYVDTDGIPVWDGELEVGELKSLAEVEADSPMDGAHFLFAWHSLCGSTVGGKAVILSHSFATRALHELLTTLIAAKLLGKPVSLGEVEAECAGDKTLTPEVVRTLTHKFAVQPFRPDAFTVDHDACALWFGIQTLKTSSPAALPDKEFMLKWKLELPAFFSASLDLASLRGYFYRPELGKVRYLNASVLLKDLHSRIKEMFQMLKKWDYEEFFPFIKDFIPAGKKVDSVILKFARKQRLGKKFVVCPR